jgi:DNA-directed RNA polymerase specialized sigma24 family protein
MQKSNPEAAARHISQIETLWPVVMQAHSGAPAEVRLAQEVILRRYREPIRRYLGACLRDSDAVEEVFQDFVVRFLRGDFRNANPEKGRFRDLLKSALYHLVVDHHKKKQRGLAQLSPDSPEPAAAWQPDLDSDRQFLDAWRAELLNKAWDLLRADEERTGRAYHTVLHFRAAHPELRSAQMAEQLSTALGKSVTADWVRKWLHAARERFAELLLQEVALSLREPDVDALEAELIDLSLFEYCREVLQRWRQRETGGSR